MRRMESFMGKEGPAIESSKIQSSVTIAFNLRPSKIKHRRKASIRPPSETVETDVGEGFEGLMD
ncbi:hypothetical protein PGT21_021250 [Puccinia graminis f. sp. tritici]|uniref:Uncharacterized protein n=1 Tax=Puccinia graminis f. sp. tritici TaxID=56615 RepID=A0A5B0N983_PUCGR|nr:hypothetical protein PGT21_021250 [Puccinia graminis f. sp. tritici]KAA1112128.1 hypothetical protein PGTUg99_004149 [Puccinia graminis f. sp. tritici]